MNPTVLELQSTISDLTAQLETLNHAIEARDKTIKVLMRRVMEKQTARSSAFNLLEENSVLQEVVAQKTSELEEQHHKLEETHQALKNAQTEMLQAQKMESIGRLASGVAHEINTPMQYIADNTDFIRDCLPKVKMIIGLMDEMLAAHNEGRMTPELLSTIEQNYIKAQPKYLISEMPQAINDSLEGVERVSKIIRAMKEFSHPGSQERDLADLNQAIRTTVEISRNEWKYFARIELNLDESLPQIPCYLGEFNQCILNLIINATHAIEEVQKDNPSATPTGVITIKTQVFNDWAHISVSDTGTGIPEEIRSKIFEPFFTTKPIGKGTGQGLTQVYRTVVKMHKGTIELKSEMGKGSQFILMLPLTPPPTDYKAALPL